MYRAPSMKTLQALGWLDNKQRRKVRMLVHEKIFTIHYKSVREAWKDCYHKLPWRERVMLALNEVLGTYGVEAIYHKGELKAEYCNTGDTYAPTIIYRYDTDTISVGSWGDLVERHNWNGEQ